MIIKSESEKIFAVFAVLAVFVLVEMRKMCMQMCMNEKIFIFRIRTGWKSLFGKLSNPIRKISKSKTDTKDFTLPGLPGPFVVCLLWFLAQCMVLLKYFPAQIIDFCDFQYFL